MGRSPRLRLATSSKGRIGPRTRWCAGAARTYIRLRIEKEFKVEVHERTVGKFLNALGYRSLSVGPQHPKSDPEAQETFKKASASCAECLSAEAKSKPLEIWFQDKARVGQQGTLTRVWAERGSRPRAPRDQRYE